MTEGKELDRRRKPVVVSETEAQCSRFNFTIQEVRLIATYRELCAGAREGVLDLLERHAGGEVFGAVFGFVCCALRLWVWVVGALAAVGGGGRNPDRLPRGPHSDFFFY